MIRRQDAWIAGLGSVATVLIVALAWAGSTNRFPVVPAFVGTLLTIVVAALAMKLRWTIKESGEELERARAQATLEKAEQLQSRRSVDSLADGLDVALLILDERGIVVYANRPARDFFRFVEPVGRSLLSVTLSYDLEQLVKNAIREGAPASRELSFRHPEDRICLAKAWSGSDGTGRVFLSVFDVTDLRRLERVRQDFVANVSHELRTPMTLVRAMAETLLDDAPAGDELAHRYLSKIISEVDRLSTITQDLLILSAAESNTARKQWCDLAEIIRGIVCQLTQAANDKGLTLTYEGEASLKAEINPAEMTQVGINLIENAIKYTPSGSVTVRLERQGDRALFEVEDTGIGIASDHQGRVFERFYRVDKGRSRASGGTGLGLSIVKHIVESHGGKVSLQSSLNQGSIFTAATPVGKPPVSN